MGKLLASQDNEDKRSAVKAQQEADDAEEEEELRRAASLSHQQHENGACPSTRSLILPRRRCPLPWPGQVDGLAARRCCSWWCGAGEGGSAMDTEGGAQEGGEAHGHHHHQGMLLETGSSFLLDRGASGLLGELASPGGAAGGSSVIGRHSSAEVHGRASMDGVLHADGGADGARAKVVSLKPSVQASGATRRAVAKRDERQPALSISIECCCFAASTRRVDARVVARVWGCRLRLCGSQAARLATTPSTTPTSSSWATRATRTTARPAAPRATRSTTTTRRPRRRSASSRARRSAPCSSRPRSCRRAARCRLREAPARTARRRASSMTRTTTITAAPRRPRAS